MALSGKQSPLGINTLSGLISNQGININPVARNLLGFSRTNDDYAPGALVNNTCLNTLTYAINDAYQRGQPSTTGYMVECNLQTNTAVPSTATLTVGKLMRGYIKVGMTLTSSNPATFAYNIFSAGSFVNGQTYVIKTVGTTDFTLIGAPSNTPGVSFVATGPGLGNGTAYINTTLTIISNIIGEGSSSKWTVSVSPPPPSTADYIDLKNLEFNASIANYTVNNTVYTNMLQIGQSRIPALGNTKPPTYIDNDPSGVWSGQATSGYAIPGPTGQGQDAKWQTWNATADNASVTQWGFLRLLALQAWNEFNYNGMPELIKATTTPPLKSYAQTFIGYNGFLGQSNQVIVAMRQSKKFGEGTFSNTNDMITADITGVSLSSQAFGQDLINLGRALNLARIENFGLPSTLLQVMQQNSAVSPSVSLALIGTGMTHDELNTILLTGTATPEQEKKLYDAFTVVDGQDLQEVLQVMRVTTKGITTLADLLSVKKLFPISRSTLTVPIYNTSPGPTNSKTYYLLFVNDDLNPQLLAPAVQAQTPVVVSYPELDTVTPVIAVETPIEEEKQAIINAPAPILPQVINNIYSRPSTGGGGGCVALESFIPLVETEQKHNGREITKAWMLESGMKISLGTEELIIVDGSVVKTLNDYQPCVRISTVDGITLVCSTTAPIYTKEKGFIPATEVYGKRVAVMRNGRTWYDEVVGLEDVGMKFVRVIDAGDNSFWAGERPGGFILHHNVPIKETLNYDKK
jgi:hypothetical protein